MRVLRWLATLVLPAALAAGCDRIGLTSAARVRLDPDSAVLAVHERLHLTLRLHDVSFRDVYLISSDTAVVVVDQQGTTQAVGYSRAVVTAYDMLEWALADSAVLRVPAPPGPWVVLLPDTMWTSPGTGRRLAWRIGNTADHRVRFSTSDPTVAEVSDSGLVCGLSGGRAVIRAVSAGDVAAADSTLVTVVTSAPGTVAARGAVATPPTISIVNIVDTAGHPVDITAVRGTIRVIINLNVPQCAPRMIVQLMIDGKLWESGPDVIRGEVRTYTFTVDTRAVGAAGRPRIPNGTHTLSVILRRADDTVVASTSQSMVVAN